MGWCWRWIDSLFKTLYVYILWCFKIESSLKFKFRGLNVFLMVFFFFFFWEKELYISIIRSIRTYYAAPLIFEFKTFAQQQYFTALLLFLPVVFEGNFFFLLFQKRIRALTKKKPLHYNHLYTFRKKRTWHEYVLHYTKIKAQRIFLTILWHLFILIKQK